MSRVCPQHRAGRVVLWAVLLDLAVMASWQMVDPLRRSERPHGTRVGAGRLVGGAQAAGVHVWLVAD